jgi:hypothetical protein
MNVDRVLAAMNDHGVRCLLIGGMNFLLRHEPVLTYDVDLWIEDTEENGRRCETALASLDAAWGPTESEWRPVAELPAGWLGRQRVFALTTAHGAVDIFRSVAGLSDWASSFANACLERTAAGTPYRGLSDSDMLRCQEALDASERKWDRVRRLREVMGRER